MAMLNNQIEYIYDEYTSIKLGTNMRFQVKLIEIVFCQVAGMNMNLWISDHISENWDTQCDAWPWSLNGFDFISE